MSYDVGALIISIFILNKGESSSEESSVEEDQVAKYGWTLVVQSPLSSQFSNYDPFLFTLFIKCQEKLQKRILKRRRGVLKTPTIRGKYYKGLSIFPK